MELEHNVKDIVIKEIAVGDNSRLEIKKEDLSPLMESIKQQGLLQAIGVIPYKGEKGKKYKVIYGNRRLTAFKKLRKRLIPARIHEDVKELADQIILNLVENDQRKGIDSFEFGRACVHLNEELDYTMNEIASALSCSTSRVKSCIDIYKQLPVEFAGKIRTMPFGEVRSRGVIPSSMAKTIVQMKRKYSLKKDQVNLLLKYAENNPEINQRTLNHIMLFMSQGVSLNQAMKKLRDIVIKRYEFPIDKKQVDVLVNRYGSLNNAIQEIVYRSGEIKDPRPQ